MSARRPPLSARRAPPRDQDRSGFTAILERLVTATPAAQAAILVDQLGETVDYAGDYDPFDLKVTAAHWQIVMAQIALSLFGPVRQITVRSRLRSYVLRQLDDAYVIVLIVHRSAAFGGSERALKEAEARLRTEAGWPDDPGPTRWYSVDVQTDPADRHRPARLRIASGWATLEVMGAMMGLPAHEKGFRVRLPSGAETILVRERLGRWFADQYLGD